MPVMDGGDGRRGDEYNGGCGQGVSNGDSLAMAIRNPDLVLSLSLEASPLYAGERENRQVESWEMIP